MPATGWYERRLLPYVLDFACGLKAIRRQREKVVPLASGRVLEVGIGTGLNMRFYDRSRVTKLVGIDPAAAMHRLAAGRIAAAGLDVELLALSAERIPVADGSFDSIVLTYTLCSIPDPVAALREMRRVLKPGGRLLFCEHGRAPDDPVRRWQERLQPWWGALAGVCQLGRDIPQLLVSGGFALPELHTGYIPGPRFAAFNYWGTAEAG